MVNSHCYIGRRVLCYCFLHIILQAKLGLNAAHEHFIVEYLQVAKYKRAQCLKDVESAFNDLAESRLIEETFTGQL